MDALKILRNTNWSIIRATLSVYSNIGYDQDHNTIMVLEVTTNNGVLYFVDCKDTLKDYRSWGMFNEGGKRQIHLIREDRISVVDLASIVSTFKLEVVDAIYTTYDRVQCYGGSEEGGWYYHTETPTDTLTEEEFLKWDVELGQYGEGQLAKAGVFYAQHSITGRPYYC